MLSPVWRQHRDTLTRFEESYMSTKATAARIYEYGEPDVFRFETMDVPDPVGHEVLVRNTVIGLNFVDIYYRGATLPVAEFPAIIAWDSSDWNSIECGESANRSPSGLHSGSQLKHGRLRRTHLRVDWWPGSKGCLRLGRQGYVPGLTRGTETPRHAGSVRQSIGFPGTNQSI